MKKNSTKLKIKTLTVLFVCCLSAFAMSFSSCSKEKKLDGTIWVGSFMEEFSWGTTTHEWTLTFIGSSVNVKIKDIMTDYEGDTSTGNYSLAGTFTCDKNDITLIIDGDTYKGTIDKGIKTMILNMGEESVVFAKQ